MGFARQLTISLLVVLAAASNYALASADTSIDSSTSDRSASATENRINAIAEFLLDRANNNFMYILQQNMKANDLLACYFPSTYKYASSNNLQLLLLSSNTKLWQSSVDDDLKNIGDRLIFNEIKPNTLRSLAKTLDSYYIATLQQIKVKVDGKEYPVDQLPIDATPELKNAVNSFYDDYLTGRHNLDVILADIEGNSSSQCSPAISVDKVLRDTKKSLDSLKMQLSRLKNADVVWNGDAKSAPGASFYNQVVSRMELFGRLKELKSRIDQIQISDDSTLRKMLQLDQLIREELERRDNTLLSISDMHEYNQFSEYALSFAILSEARSREEVKAVLQQLALPPVSFGIKREADAEKVMISAFFGAQIGAEGWGKGYGGLSVPIGLEYSHGLRNGGAVSVMLAPFDFAHPINQVINSGSGTSTLKDIVNPGMYVTYGFKKYPVVLGAGISRGPSLTQAQAGNKVRYFMFLGMDMPLFSFY